jgi:hypothetical protein
MGKTSVEYQREYRAANKEKINERARALRAANPEKKRAKDRAWRRANPEKVRGYNLKRYSLTLEQWETMFAAQGKACKICSATDPGSKGGWHTDHDHSTGKVRGILCQPCNHTVHSKTTPAILRAAACYLEEAPTCAQTM